MPESLPAAIATTQNAITELSETLQQLQRDKALTRDRVTELSKASGVYGLRQPQDFGGKDAGPLEIVVVHEVLAAHNLIHLPGLFGPQPGLLKGVGEPLKSQYLAPMLAGEKQGAFAFTEPDEAEKPTSATVDSDHLVINGQKSYVTGGATADYINALVHIDDVGPAMVLIDTSTPGLEIVNQFESADGSHHVGMQFKNLRVPKSHIVGEAGRGIPRAMDQIGDVRLVLSAQSVGLMQWVIAQTKKHLQKPHRSGQPLGAKEGVRMRYADMRIKAYASRSMLYRTAKLAEQDDNSINEVVATKVFTTEAIGEIVDAAIQLHGGMAIQSGHPLEVLSRRVRAWRFTEGASDVLRLNLVKGDLDLGLGRI